MHHLAGVRAGLPQLHASAQTRVLLETDDGVLAVVRTHPSGSMVCVYNVTASWQTVESATSPTSASRTRSTRSAATRSSVERTGWRH